MSTPCGVIKYFSTLFDFIGNIPTTKNVAIKKGCVYHTDGATEAGGSVLVHCLAGAHRAGTAGTSIVMYKGGMRLKPALRTSKMLRSAVSACYAFFFLAAAVAAL